MGQIRQGPWSPKALAVFWALGGQYSRRLKDLGHIDEQMECGRFAVVVEAAFLTRAKELGDQVSEEMIEGIRAEFVDAGGHLTDFGLSRCDDILNEEPTDD